MASSETVLSWSEISKSYGRRALFAGATGELRCGQTLVVTGANGSGKSTFLKIAAGLLLPDAGDFIRPHRHSIGYCSPSLDLYADLTGSENLSFFAGVVGHGNFKPTELLERVGLARAEKKLYSAYSSGMKQRLKLAFALLQNPLLLILDEPTIALDGDGVLVVDNIISSHRALGGCTLIATNDPVEVERWASDRWGLGSQA